VREALERVLASQAFRKSEQCQKFLRFVVEHSCCGDEQLLRERNIGVHVFGRAADYDTAGDPVVRVRATEVRKRLAQYHGEMPGDNPRFELPAGSYRVELHWDAAAPVVQPARRKRWPAAVAGIAVLAIAAVFLVRGLVRPRSIVDQFWAPVLESPRGVLIYCGQPVVYFLSRDVHERYRRTAAAGKPRGSYAVTLDPAETLRATDVIPVTDQFVGIGNAHTSSLLAAMFAARQKPVEIRYASDLSFSDLRGSPSVLIGAFSNQWTLEMQGQLRYAFEQEGGVRRIRDKSTGKIWQLAELAPDGKTPEDYAVVSRLLNSGTGQVLISAAGITQYGTRAAGEFLTGAPLMKEALAKADWTGRNVQVVLHTAVHRGTPESPSVVATHIW